MKRFYLFLLFIISLTYQTSFYVRANENNLIDTLSILKQEFYPVSPLHGAVAWQQEWVMKLYDLGWDRDKSTGKLSITDEQPPALINLIDRLFHRPPGTAGMMNFSPTKDIRDQMSGDVVQTLGKIIALLPGFNTLKELAANLKTESNIEKVNTVASELSNVNDEDFFEKLAESKKALQNVKIPKKAVSAVEFKKLINEFCEFKENCRKLVRGADTAQLLRQAFLQNPQETLLTLLALLWACCESRRGDLAKYYQALDEKTREVRNTSIFSKDQAPGWDKWIADKFDPKSKDNMIEALQKFEGIFEKNPQHYEALVYLVLMPDKYPKISEYKTATLWFNGTEHHNVTFADCMDSSMMNFLLILAYNKDTMAFNADFLKQKFELQALNEKLEQFLTSNHPAFNRKIKDKEDSKINLTPQTVEEIEIHNAWTDVVSDIPGVAYNKCLRGKSVESCQSTKGFIVVTPKLKDAPGLQKAGYITVIPAEGICFELQPSLKNFIVLFNYLLNLNLFNPANVYDEILKPNFVKTYLPILAEKLKMEIELNVSLDKIDEKDYGDQILTKLGFDDEFPFELSTSHGHGEIIKKYNTFAKKLKNTFDMRPMTSDLLPSFRGIKLGNMAKEEIKEGMFIANKTLNFYDLPWFDVSTSSAIVSILDGIKHADTKVAPELQGYFISLAENQPDPEIKLDIFAKVVLVFEKLSGKYESVILTAASKGLISHEQSLSERAMDLFRALFDKGQGYQEAIETASKWYQEIIDTKDAWNADIGFKYNSALYLFEALLDKDQGYQEAIETASKCLMSSNQLLRHSALCLFTELVKKGQGYQEAIAAASKYFAETEAESNSDLEIRALCLFTELVKKGQGQKEAIAAASKCLADPHRNIRRKALDVFKALPEGGEEKLAEIIKGMQNKGEARKFFDSIKEDLKDTKIKKDLEQYFSQL